MRADFENELRFAEGKEKQQPVGKISWGKAVERRQCLL